MADLKYYEDDFIIQDGELVLGNTIAQDLSFRLDTPKGSHWYYTGYGSDYDPVGEPNSPQTHMKVISALEDCLQQDDRVISAKLQLTTTESVINVKLVINELYEVATTL